MGAVTIPALTDAAIPFLGGLFCTLYSFRLIGKLPDADPIREQRREQMRRSFRLLGPALMFGSVVLLFAKPSPPPRPWQTVTTADGVCRIDMPATPTASEGPAMKELGKPELLQMLAQNQGEAHYTLGCAEISTANREVPVKELLETIGKNWLIAARHLGEPQLIGEQNLTENGWPGKEIVIDLDDQRLQQRWFVVEDRLYRALVSSPRDDKHLQDARRFLESLRIASESDADKGS